MRTIICRHAQPAQSAHRPRVPSTHVPTGAHTLQKGRDNTYTQTTIFDTEQDETTARPETTAGENKRIEFRNISVSDYNLESFCCRCDEVGHRAQVLEVQLLHCTQSRCKKATSGVITMNLKTYPSGRGFPRKLRSFRRANKRH